MVSLPLNFSLHMSTQVTTLTFYKYQSLWDQLWAFGMMQFAHRPMKKVEGLTFYKLLGSGRENFDPRPDFSVYAVLQVWENENMAKAYFDSSALNKRYAKHTSHQLTLYMKSIRAHGLWSGKNPFEPSGHLSDDNPYVAVITRATIKLTMLKNFWDYVPTSQKDLQNNPNLLLTAGLGERPVTQMATFSLWDDASALKKFAYRGTNHRHAVQQTQALQWYKEELFTRFQPYHIKGSWPGFNIPKDLE